MASVPLDASSIPPPPSRGTPLGFFSWDAPGGGLSCHVEGKEEAEKEQEGGRSEEEGGERGGEEAEQGKRRAANEGTSEGGVDGDDGDERPGGDGGGTGRPSEIGKGGARGAEGGLSGGEGSVERGGGLGVLAATASAASMSLSGAAGAVRLMKAEYEELRPVAATNCGSPESAAVSAREEQQTPVVVADGGSAVAACAKQPALPMDMLGRVSGTLVAFLQALALCLRSPFSSK